MCSVFVSISCEDVSSVCSIEFSFEITVDVDKGTDGLAFVGVVANGDEDDVGTVDEYCCKTLEDGIELLVVDASLADGVVTDKAPGKLKSLAESPATILMGAYERK